jgi:hypothetical protein
MNRNRLWFGALLYTVLGVFFLFGSGNDIYPTLMFLGGGLLAWIAWASS